MGKSPPDMPLKAQVSVTTVRHTSRAAMVLGPSVSLPRLWNWTRPVYSPDL